MRRKFLSCSYLLLLIAMVGRSQEKLIYHSIKTDRGGAIIPWYSPDPAKAYDHIIRLVWNFWDTMRIDMNGLPYYMNHQVWNAGSNDPRGLGGDQFNMALSSWQLYYAYTGNERVKENMRFMAEYYLSHSLSGPDAKWPQIPYPYNTLVYSGFYDGDMVLGKDITQPDKAGTFGLELVHLFKMTSRERYPNQTCQRYLDAAIEIANTLAKHTEEGDVDHSPLPFKVNAITGETAEMLNNDRSGAVTGPSSYTSNWTGTMELFLELEALHAGDSRLYSQAFERILHWMKAYPLKNNRWGPFFEDVPGWSDTQINAITFAQFMMKYPEYFPNWRQDVKGIFAWVYERLGNREWEKYGVTVVNEQTAYLTPGNSHTARQACAELQFMAGTGDWTGYEASVRRLNWATYMVDNDGKNRYPRDDNWLTDGYGDYVRHFIRAMAAAPQLAPPGEDHLLSSTSIVQQVFYAGQISKQNFLPVRDTKRLRMIYYVYDPSGIEVLRLARKPRAVMLDDKIAIANENGEGFKWKALPQGGVLTVSRSNAKTVRILD